jgi:hypothetical protein
VVSRGLAPVGSSKCFCTCFSTNAVSDGVGTRVVSRKTEGPISKAAVIRRSETLRSSLRSTLSSLMNLEWNFAALRIILPGGVIMMPWHDRPWTVCLPLCRAGHLAEEQDTAGASEGGGCLSRVDGATAALAGALTLGGVGRLILVRLTWGFGTGRDPVSIARGGGAEAERRASWQWKIHRQPGGKDSVGLVEETGGQ